MPQCSKHFRVHHAQPWTQAIEWTGHRIHGPIRCATSAEGSDKRELRRRKRTFQVALRRTPQLHACLFRSAKLTFFSITALPPMEHGRWSLWVIVRIGARTTRTGRSSERRPGVCRFHGANVLGEVDAQSKGRRIMKNKGCRAIGHGRMVPGMVEGLRRIVNSERVSLVTSISQFPGLLTHDLVYTGA